jgi:hypothetical protein
MSLHSAPAQSELLTSWKEIANYLGKGVRTVQRWEQQFGLPVRRPNEKAKGIIHATRGELDHWLAGRWSRRNPDEARTFVSDKPSLSDAVHTAILRSVELRDANRRLINEFARSLNTVFQGCQTLAQCPIPPHAAIEITEKQTNTTPSRYRRSVAVLARPEEVIHE